MEDNDSSSDNSSYFADEESDEDNRRETTDLTSPVSFGPSTSSSGFSFGCNYDIVEDDEEGQNLSRRASLPIALPVEHYPKAGGAYRIQSLDRGAETRRPVAWLEDAEIVSEPRPILTHPGSLDLVDETRGAVGWKQSSEIVEEARYPGNVELTHSQKENPADRSEPRRVVNEEKACRCVEHSDTSKVQPLVIKDSRKSKSKPELKYYHFQRRRQEREGFKTYIKTLFPIRQLLDALRKRVVVQSENVLYFPQLSKPIELSTSDYLLNLELRYGRRKRQFVLVKTLDGLGGQHSRMFLATHNPGHHDASDFLVLKSFRKIDGPVRLDTTSSRLTLRRELRVFKRLATLKDNVRRFVVGSAGVLENEHAHYVIMPAMYCSLLDVLLKKTKVKKNVFAKAWIAQLGHGLNCLHHIGIIHRNLKPNNIFVDWNGSLKITDFSCAYIDPSSSSSTSNRRMPPLPQLVSGMHYAYRTRGTPEYMAPEVFEMTSRSAIAKFGKDDVDEQIAGLKGYGKEVDIWALGCVAAEILRQEDGYEQLFERPGSREAFVWASQGEQFGRLESFGIYAHLAVDLVHKMLQVNPSRRLQLDQMKGHFYYSPATSAKSFDEYLDTHYSKEKRLALVLNTDLSAAPTSPDCILELSAKRPKRTRPSIDSDEGYTWINPTYLTDD